jgi:5-methyltetrahydropteroyltriglutamate--homocysteine methyltransferase
VFRFAPRRHEEEAFAEFYSETQGAGIGGIRRPVCVGPISYQGETALRADLENLRAALEDVQPEDVFVSSAAPGSIEVFARGQNRYYPSEEAFLAALVEAMQVEYEAIVDAGFILQIDDPGLPDAWDMLAPAPAIAEYRRYAQLRVDALNTALRRIPEERVRYHICWGSWHGPHATDVPLKDIVHLLLRVKAQAYLFEAANVRHEHEYHLWEQIRLPEGKILIPGVVSHATNVLEHPELVAERIGRFVERVGKEHVMAGTDCGLGGRVHPQLAWAKLQVLVEGAALASQAASRAALA